MSRVFRHIHTAMNQSITASLSFEKLDVFNTGSGMNFASVMGLFQEILDVKMHENSTHILWANLLSLLVY